MSEALSSAISRAHDRFWAWLATNPHIADAPGVRERDVEAMDRYAAGGHPGSGERALLRFALAVWNDQDNWQCGRFVLNDLRSLDDNNLAWVAAWVEDPRWP